MAAPIAVYLEVGPKRTFAGAIEWPGWSRSGRTEGDALGALLRYADRYAKVAATAKVPFAPASDGSEFAVVERLPGNATTDFGAPGVPPGADSRLVSGDELKRVTSLLTASWRIFDEIAAGALGVELRKGPRGGGRDLPKIESHVLEAEEAYLLRLGSRVPRLAASTVPARTYEMSKAIVETLAARALDRPIADPSAVEKRWSPRYFVRRAAWHVLDHAWEIEDRSAV